MKRFSAGLLYVVLAVAISGLSGCVVYPYDDGGYRYHHFDDDHGFHHGHHWEHEYRG